MDIETARRQRRRHITRILTAAALLLLAGATLAEATDYYVSVSGADAQSGLSPTQAWRSIQRVNNQDFDPGDRIFFEGGHTFSGSLYFDSADAGLPDAPITISSYGSGRATIYPDIAHGILVYNAAGFRITDLYVVGSGRDSNTGAGIFFYTDLPGDVKLQGIVIERVDAVRFREAGILIGANAGRTGYKDIRLSRIIASENGKHGIFTYAAVPNTHEEVYVGQCAAFLNAGYPNQTFNTGNGITISGVAGATIERSVAHDNGWRSTSGNGPIGIWTFSSTRVLIQYNESYNNRTGSTKDGGGFSLDNDTSQSVLQYNYSHGNMGAGYLLAHKPDNFQHTGNVIRYNITENDARRNEFASIHLWGRIRNAEIYNNTVYVSPTPAGTPGVPRAIIVRNNSIPLQDVEHVHFRNNIIVTTSSLRAVEVTADQLAGGVDLRFENNLYFGSGYPARFYWGGTSYSGLAAWRTATGQEKSGSTNLGIEADPMLTRPGGGVALDDAMLLDRLEGYRIRSGSPAIDAARSMTTYGIDPGTHDYYGTSLPQWAAYDLGAHELSVDCTFAIDRTNASLSFAGGSGTVGVAASPDTCGWTAYSNRDWLWINGPKTGEGNGAISWSASANPLTATRTGTITIAAQTFTVQQAPQPTTVPTVSIVSPANGSSFTSGATITIEASAADEDGTIARVDFLVNGTVIGSDDSHPYAVVWTAPADGRYTLSAAAVDNAGLVGRSGSIGITVGVPTGELPTGWTSADIGAVGVPGYATASGGTITIGASGLDIWGSADSFRLAYRTLDGDGSITARVASVENTHAWAKAGVMIRETLDPGSRHASMFVSPGKGLSFQRRTTTAGTSVSTAGPLVTAPRWVRMTRAGSTFTAAWSNDGATWTTVGTATMTMGDRVLIGLAMTSHDNTRLGEGVFDQVVVEAATPPLPSPWTNQDVGSVTLAGSASEANGVFRLKASGADIWGTADAFHFVYRRVTGDGELVARVTSLTNTHSWAKAGVMIREDTTAGSRHASMFVSPTKGLSFQRRPTVGGISLATPGTLNAPPIWVRVVRQGSVFTASQSFDGVSWTIVGTETIAMPADALWGLALTSHNTATLGTGVFENVSVVMR